MIRLKKERTGGHTGAVTGEKSKDGNLGLEQGMMPFGAKKETRSIKGITS